MIIETIAVVAGVAIAGGVVKFVNDKFVTNKTVNTCINRATDAAAYAGLAVAGIAMGMTPALYALYVYLVAGYLLNLIPATFSFFATTGIMSKLTIVGLWLITPVSTTLFPAAMGKSIKIDVPVDAVDMEAAVAA